MWSLSWWLVVLAPAAILVHGAEEAVWNMEQFRLTGEIQNLHQNQNRNQNQNRVQMQTGVNMGSRVNSRTQGQAKGPGAAVFPGAQGAGGLGPFFYPELYSADKSHHQVLAELAKLLNPTPDPSVAPDVLMKGPAAGQNKGYHLPTTPPQPKPAADNPTKYENSPYVMGVNPFLIQGFDFSNSGGGGGGDGGRSDYAAITNSRTGLGRLRAADANQLDKLGAGILKGPNINPFFDMSKIKMDGSHYGWGDGMGGPNLSPPPEAPHYFGREPFPQFPGI